MDKFKTYYKRLEKCQLNFSSCSNRDCDNLKIRTGGGRNPRCPFLARPLAGLLHSLTHLSRLIILIHFALATTHESLLAGCINIFQIEKIEEKMNTSSEKLITLIKEIKGHCARTLFQLMRTGK